MRGRAGYRSAYQPVRTPVFPSAKPADVGRVLIEKFGCEIGYVADLDAIAGAEPDWSSMTALRSAGLALWADIGLRNADHAARLASRTWSDGRDGCGLVDGVIAGLETVSSADALAEMLGAVGTNRLIFSLDLHAGKPLTRSPAWRELDAEQILHTVYHVGVRRFIVLDVARVGSGQGTGTEPICRRLRAISNDIEIVAGGGVRGASDLDRLRRSGCQAALVASALYDGLLTVVEMQRLTGSARIT